MKVRVKDISNKNLKTDGRMEIETEIVGGYV
jgi:hypothetical protein